MSPSDYKKRQLEALAAARDETRKNLEIAFDTSETVQQRLTALSSLGSISDPTYVQRAIELIDDPRASAEVRAAVLDKIAGYVGRDEDLIDWSADILADRGQPEPVREAALRVLQINSFSSSTMLAHRPRYLSTLRGLIDDPSSSIRDTAIEVLAMNQDEYVQRRLIEGLDDPNKRIAEPEKAVQLLSYDLHAEHFPVLRRLAQNPPNQKTRMEALRNLGADAASADLLRAALANDSEDPEVRHLCAVALQRIDPTGFEAEADRILGEDGVEPELKVALLNTKLHTPGVDQKVVLDAIRALNQEELAEDAGAQAAKLWSIAEQKST
jgi:HEAT repeat protein